MDKTAIRNFAIWARNKLISDVAYRAGLMGITSDGIADKLPQSTNSVQFYDIGTSEPYQITGKEIAQRSNLVFLIKRKANSSNYATAYTSIIEEVAYTWFNRLIAVRFMEVNDYLPSHVRVLSSESGKIEPDIVTNPFDVDLGITEKESSKIIELKQNNESDALFKLLFIKQCNKLSEILPRLFEKTDDYTELLFNCSYVDQEGIVYRLTHDIPEEDFDIDRGGQVEIIGWLYQFYNAELKDDTFALLKKNIKITKERIPSATQLFTPDWIVRYMVENSLGRLWTEGHANTSVQLRDNWKYYLEEVEQETEVQLQLNDIRKEYAKLRPEDIKLIDPCMGSGHILVYAFDVLIQIYESEGYSQRDAAIQILENNIFGLDIDDRAAQLAYFAVMMKARQYNRRILDGTHDCHVLAIQESNGMSTLQTYMAPFGELSDVALRLINTYNDAKEYGSILNVPLSLEEIDALAGRLEEIRNNRSNDVEELMVEAALLNDIPPLLEQAWIMVQKYDVVVTNPPYMGSAGMSDRLSSYVKKIFPLSKSDLFSCFMEKAYSLAKKNGYTSLITMESWMFLSSFEELRKLINRSKTIVNMVHMPYLGKGRTSMGINFGTAAVVMNNIRVNRYSGQYEYTVYYDTDDDGVPFVFPTINERWCSSRQEDYSKIEGSPIAYWISDQIYKDYELGIPLGDLAAPRKGNSTSDNIRFLRLWYEVANNKLNLNANRINREESKYKRWYPYNKGGDFRRWYGNNSYVVDWYNDAEEIRKIKTAVIANYQYFCQEGLTWSTLTSGNFSIRKFGVGFIFDNGGCCVFELGENEDYVLSLLNSTVFKYIFGQLNPTLNFQSGEVAKFPVILEQNDRITKLATENISMSRHDWDSFETSWEFKKHPLI